MIKTSEKNRIIKILGKRYVAPIQAVLKEQESVNRNNEPYSPSQITNVMNGNTSHKVIETAIVEAVKRKKEELQKQKDEIKKVLSK